MVRPGDLVVARFPNLTDLFGVIISNDECTISILFKDGSSGVFDKWGGDDSLEGCLETIPEFGNIP